MSLNFRTGMLYATIAVLWLAPAAQAQERQSASSGLEPKIAWFGRLSDGLAEAKRTNRPILLVSAAPQCEGVPGIW